MKFLSYIQKTLNELKIIKFTNIQEKVIPLLLKEKNVIAISQTGSGKTLAYLLAILEKLDLNNQQVQAIIISPTRELATQINNVLNYFKKNESKLKTNLLIGGSDFKRQLRQLQNNLGQIIIATPNRLLSIFKTGINWNLSKYLKYVVYDEVDMFIDQSFLNEFIKLRNRFTKIKPIEIALSATLHNDVIVKLKKFIDKPCIVNTIEKSIWVNEKIKHYLVTNKSNDKYDSLEAIIKQIRPYLCLIFVNKYQNINEIQRWFTNHKINTISLYGKLPSSVRKQNFKQINSLKVTYVITTDLASRGIDIDGVSHVISWNLPKDDIWYIHRSGRTSRSIYTGESYVMYDESDELQLKRLQKKGIVWIPLKVNKTGNLIKHTIIYKNNIDHKIKDAITSKKIKKIKNEILNSKVQPNYKKKVKLKLKKIHQKMKRQIIEKKVKKILIKKYRTSNKN